MPNYTICTEDELVDFFPTLKALFIDDEMLNIIKLNHTEENCRAGSGPVLNGSHPLLHLVFLHPALEPIMRQVIVHLISLYPAEDPNDPHNFPNCILMCPTCGRRFVDQPNRSSRES